MRKLLNRKKHIVVLALSLLLCYGVMKYALSLIKKIELEGMLQENDYLDLATQNLQSEWNCLPDTPAAREDFILKLMQRLALDEYTQFNRGKEWVAEYRRKELSGLLTVEERKQAFGSLKPLDSGGELYYIFPWTIDSSVVAYAPLLKSLGIDACALDAAASCPSIQRFITNTKYGIVDVLYEKQGIRWRVGTSEWYKLLRTEYRLLTYKKVRVWELEEEANKNRALLDQARQNVSKMSADDAPLAKEAEYVRREYKRLRCH
ncbi:MAG: hypothetical protein PHX61_10240 [Alphaproteobacteria bacterium]|nr:hypothetical protein [Alphaproteobacteria bacterium]